MKISGFVITYNSGDVLKTCLRSLRFVDELIVVDKSSTDGTPAVAASFADKVITVPWSPIPTETRFVAHDACSNDFIIYLDHDECLNVEGIRWVKQNAGSHPASIFWFPKREYILGTHDEAAYYYPMRNVRAFRRGFAKFVRTLHLEVEPQRGSEAFHIPLESGVCIEHLSYRDAAHWVEKTNRYTSEKDRVSYFDATIPLEAFAQERIAYWLAQSRSRSDYVVSVALLRAVYDIVDRVKLWEQEHGVDADQAFASVCTAMEASYDRYEAGMPDEIAGGSPADLSRAAPTAIRSQLGSLLRRLRGGG